MTLKTKHKILLASLLFRGIRFARTVCGKRMSGTFTRSGFTWQLDLREVVDFMIFLTGSFEGYLNRFISRNVKEGEVVMDIGANIGAHTLMMGKSVGKTGRAYAIEATEYAYEKLTDNIRLNPSIEKNITTTHSIFSSQASPNDGIEIHSSWPFETDSERHESHQGVFKTTGTAPITCLDDYVKAQGIERLDLIKIDVDGNESDVLAGGQNTLTSMQPVLLMEVAPDYHTPNHTKGFYNIHELLTGIGYVFYSFEGKPLPADSEKLAATIPAGASRNVVIVPRDKCMPTFH